MPFTDVDFIEASPGVKVTNSCPDVRVDRERVIAEVYVEVRKDLDYSKEQPHNLLTFR